MVGGLGGRDLACDDAQRTGQIDGDKDVESVLARIELADQVCEKILVLLGVPILVAQQQVDVGDALAKDHSVDGPGREDDVITGHLVLRVLRAQELILISDKRQRPNHSQLLVAVVGESLIVELVRGDQVVQPWVAEGDALEVWTLVRDRFGAAIPAISYPTASSALAAAYAEDEGVAVLPAPGGMNSWWSALCTGGAATDMTILAGLPRIGSHKWPRAVAVATAERQPSGADTTLIAVKNSSAIFDAGMKGVLRAEAGDNRLFSVSGFITPEDNDFKALLKIDPAASIIGCLPDPLPETASR